MDTLNSALIGQKVIVRTYSAGVHIGELTEAIEIIPLVGRQGLFNWTPDESVDHLLGPSLDHGAACRHYGWAA